MSFSSGEEGHEVTFFAKSAAGGSWIALFNFEGPHKGNSKGGLTQAQTSYGGVAQLGEHLPCKQGVDSSILFVSTKRFGRMAQRTATDMGS